MSKIDTLNASNDGIVFVRIAKQINGVFAGWHRTSIQPGDDATAIMNAVNLDLTKLGCDNIADISSLDTMIATVQTPAVIQAFQQVQQAGAAQLSGRSTANVVA